MIFLVDAERDIGKTQLQTKMSDPRSFLKIVFLRILLHEGGILSPNFKHFWCWAVLIGGVKPTIYTHRGASLHNHAT